MADLLFRAGQNPAAVIARLNSEINQLMKTTDTKRLNEAGVEAIGTTPEELAALIKGETVRMTQLIKRGNFTS